MIKLDTKIEERVHEEYTFDNVYLRMHPNGDAHAWNRIYSCISNVQLRLFLKGRLHDVDLGKVDLTRCLNCIVGSYNPGIVRHLCNNPLQCAAVYPIISYHEKMGFKPGKSATCYLKPMPQLTDSFSL